MVVEGTVAKEPRIAHYAKQVILQQTGAVDGIDVGLDGRVSGEALREKIVRHRGRELQRAQVRRDGLVPI